MATVHFVQTVDGWVGPADQQVEGKAGFGEWLRRTREARGLTLDDISRETKIPLRNLQALELGNLGFMPTFYQRAEVRAVAKAVGVDERLALGRLDSAITPVVTPPTAEVARPSLKATVSTAFVVLALGALMLTGAVRQPAGESFDSSASRREPATVAPQPPVAQSAGVSTAVSVAGSPDVATLAVASSLDVATASVAASAGVATAAVASSLDVATAAVAASPDVATAVAPLPGSFTELVVTTEPPGAHVTVNGIGWGASPVTIRHLPPGQKHIRATKVGFSAAEQVLALDGNQRRALELRLAEAP